MPRILVLAALVLSFATSGLGQIASSTPPVSAPRMTPLPLTEITPIPGKPQDVITLQYPNSDVVDVLHLYEQLTGKKLVMDNNVQGKVNIFIAKPVPREEAVRIIEMNLALNGFSLVPAEEDIIEVVGIGKNPRAAAVPIISDEADIPDGGQVVSYLFKLRYADPTELQAILSQYLAGVGAQVPILALPKSSTLLVTQSADVLRKLVKMVNQVDVAPAEVVSEFIKLERADATKVVEMLDEVFEKGNQGNTNPRGGNRGVRNVVPMPNQPPQPEVADVGMLTALSEDSIVIGKIKIAADVRTNRIHVITRPINLPFIHKLIAEFDANVDFAKPVTRPLRYISANDVLQVLVQALTEPGEDQAGGAQGANGNNPQQQLQQRRNNPNSTNSSTGNLSGTASDSTLNVSEELSTEAVDTTPQAVTIGNAKLIADQRSNSIIVLGNREVVVKVQKILDEMDVSAPQVALTTVIGSLTLNNNEEFGIDYFLKFQRQNGGAGGFGGFSRNTAVPIADPGTLINLNNLAAAASGGGTSLFLSAGDTLTALVRLLDSTGRFRTISRPTVFTTNNKKAIIASGQEIPVPVSTISSAVGSGGLVNTGLSQQSNIQFKKVALQLEVVPLINSEKEVSLDILQKLDEVQGSTRVDNNLIPNIQTRYIRTTVSAPNKSTIILGGLITDKKNRSQSGIPILGRIPLIGGLFRDTTKDKSREELIILMRPEVTLTKLDLYRLRKNQEEKTHFEADLDQDDCPDCPPTYDGKQLPPPDLPETPLEK